MIPPRHERGAALLTVLMLVAVIATVSAGVLDRLTVATRLAGNAGVAAQQCQQRRQAVGLQQGLAGQAVVAGQQQGAQRERAVRTGVAQRG